jgi:hypothetical protein
LIGFISIPFALKIIYGFTSDNIKILGSKRRGHLLVNSFSSMFMMILILGFGRKFGKYFITCCVFVSQLNMAYGDTVTDALTIQAA